MLQILREVGKQLFSPITYLFIFTHALIILLYNDEEFFPGGL